MNKFDWDALKEFIAIRSLQGRGDENARAIEFIRARLQSAGFDCRIDGGAQTEQPAIVAHRAATDSDKKIVLYGHYDVAPVHPHMAWRSDSPFVAEVIDGRLYARGIADNKGTLFTRLQVVGEMAAARAPMPEILWLIQGEEEIMRGERVAKRIFADELARFDGDVVLEETGFNDIETGAPIAFVWSKNVRHPQLEHYRNLMRAMQFERIEFRTLKKLNGLAACPLLSNLQQRHVYLGFGPNDELHQIHRENESLDVGRLIGHKSKFADFLQRYAQ